jgi:RNase adaptor protein for sRNA GlmZ degradation
VRDFIGHVLALIDQTVENYQQRNFTDLLVAFGCTGGQHRSVYCAERLAKHLREQSQVNVELRHLAQEDATLTPALSLEEGEGEKQ